MWSAWLGEEPATMRDLKAMLAPYPSDGVISWPVSPRVVNVKNNDPTLIEPIAAACRRKIEMSPGAQNRDDTPGRGQDDQGEKT
jgi:hypothetical protein